ncbi:MAG: O-antigen ligase family protein [Anaerolineales bacterium]
MNYSAPSTRDRRKLTPRQGLIIATIAISAVVLAPAAASGVRIAMALLALPLFLMVFVLFERRPGLGIPAAVVVSLLVPFTIGTGTQSGLNASILWIGFLLGIWLLDMVTRDQSIRLVDSPVIVPLMGLMVASVLAFALGQLNWLPIPTASFIAQAGGLALFLLLPGAFLLTVHQLGRIRNLEWMVWLFLGLGGLFVVGLLIGSTRKYALTYFQRAVFDSLFWTWIITLSFSQILLNGNLSKGSRILLGGICASAFYFTVVIRQSWTSGWLPGAVSIGVILLMIKPKWVLAGGALGLLAILLIPGVFDQIFLTGDNPYSLETRVAALRIMGNIIKFNPILGLGPANYYAYTPLYRILGYSVNFNSHNNYVDIVAQIGVVGLGFFLWFAGALAKEFWSVRMRMPPGFQRAYMYGAIGGLAGTMLSGLLGDWIIPFVYNIGLEGFRASSLAWMFLGGALALRLALPAEPSDDLSNAMTFEGGPIRSW